MNNMFHDFHAPCFSCMLEKVVPILALLIGFGAFLTFCAGLFVAFGLGGAWLVYNFFKHMRSMHNGDYQKDHEWFAPGKDHGWFHNLIPHFEMPHMPHTPEIHIPDMQHVNDVLKFSMPNI